MSEAGHHHGLDASSPARYRASVRVTLVSVAANLLLTAAQVVIGWIGHSQALIADGLHTLSDLVSDFLVLFALQHGRRAADENHPYGHARIETAVTLILGLVLLAVGVGIAVRAGWRLATAETFVVPASITLWAALITLAAKEALYRYTLRTAQRYDSEMLRANAWHHRSDAVSSLVVVAGIAGSLFGFAYLDSVAAIVVAVLIGKVGVEIGWGALQELIDTGLSSEQLERIRTLIASVSGVQALHLLRTRRVGGEALVDVHIIVGERLSVSEGHQISEAVRSRLIGEIDAIADVMVHIDTEEDVAGASCARLPLRDEVLARLAGHFRDIPEARLIETTTLHYLNGRLAIELLLPLAAVSGIEPARALAARLRAAVGADPEIGALDVRFH